MAANEETIVHQGIRVPDTGIFPTGTRRSIGVFNRFANQISGMAMRLSKGVFI